VRAGLPPTSA
jgi:serine/threonine protein kinase